MNEPELIGDILDQDKIRSSNLNNDKVDGRKNNGRKPGSSNKATKDAKEAKKAFIERVNKNVDKLFNAQLSLATGEQVLMVATTTGKGKEKKRTHEIVTDIDTIRQYLDWNEGLGAESPSDDDHYYYLTTRSANNMAIDSLLNRSFGKATEKIEFEGGLFKASQLTIKVIDSDNTESDTEQETTASQGITE